MTASPQSIAENVTPSQGVAPKGTDATAPPAADAPALTAARAAALPAADAAAHRRRQAAHLLRDGTQERLVSLLLGLRMAREQLGEAATPTAAGLLDGAIRDAETALAQVREVAAGLCPQVLQLRGLGPAVAALAAASPVPVTVTVRPDRTGRLPCAVETHVYFLVAEALAHAVRDSGAGRAEVELTRIGSALVVSVVSDACPPRGPGADARVAAMTECVTLLEGTLTVTCSSAAGTTVRAVLPVPTGSE
ncbi:ATP-binding protein [Streptomyces sp. MC1]|uniref:sensor histidine kinase n=1 Tax=unclassified Streptomyces TaxID=2593676 RepID=UPI00068C45EB|nr:MULTISPECIES: ATP-binding protein [unclassified Streptomyces]MBG7705069.1 ATP-binding protein [Streptomyces sp. MC1]